MGIHLKPVLPDHTSATRHPSSWKRTTTATPLFRDNFSLTTLLLVGAVAQCLLFTLPVRPLYKFGPPFLLLAFRLAHIFLQVFGLVANPNMAGVIHGRTSAVVPPSDGSWSDDRSTPGGDKVCVLLLGARSNGPLGLLDPQMRRVGAFFGDMRADLEADPEAHGYLAGKTYLAAGDRAAANELMSVIYFRSIDDLHAYAHGPVHRAAWDWWAANARDCAHISIFHESFEARAGAWESVYVNCAPTLLGTSSHRVNMPGGEKMWQSALVDARTGAMRSHAGRRGLHDGSDNEKIEQGH